MTDIDFFFVKLGEYERRIAAVTEGRKNFFCKENSRCTSRVVDVHVGYQMCKTGSLLLVCKAGSRCTGRVAACANRVAALKPDSRCASRIAAMQAGSRCSNRVAGLQIGERILPAITLLHMSDQNRNTSWPSEQHNAT